MKFKRIKKRNSKNSNNSQSLIISWLISLIQSINWSRKLADFQEEFKKSLSQSRMARLRIKT
jgi:hypothetical protein